MFNPISVNERDFIKEALESDFRVGGRSALDLRGLEVKFGKKNGQLLLKLGRTAVLTQSTLKLMSPKQAKP